MPHQTMSMLPDQRTARLAGMLAFTIVAGALSGDELRFRDGDVLTGNFVRSEEGRIIFDSVVFGRISVAEADVQLVRTDAPAGMPARPLARIEPKEAPAEQEPLVPAAAARHHPTPGEGNPPRHRERTTAPPSPVRRRSRRLPPQARRTAPRRRRGAWLRMRRSGCESRRRGADSRWAPPCRLRRGSRDRRSPTRDCSCP